jgi:hypothetical protein
MPAQAIWRSGACIALPTLASILGKTPVKGLTIAQNTAFERRFLKYRDPFTHVNALNTIQRNALNTSLLAQNTMGALVSTTINCVILPQDYYL